MSLDSQYVLFGDGSWPVESFAKALPEDSPVCVWIDGKGWVLPGRGKFRQTSDETSPTSIQAAESCHLKEHPIAIIGFENTEQAQKISDVLKHRCSDIKILRVGTRGSTAAMKEIKRSVSWQDLLHKEVGQELELLSLQEKVRDLKKLLTKEHSVGILIQNDPDPDAMASALALRKLLGRKSQRFPIVSFSGLISRPENRAMAKLLDIEVHKVTLKKLTSFDRIVCVDCQPSFFKGKNLPKIHAVLDHHPRDENCEYLKQADFVEIRQELGSTSTLMSLLLEAAKVELSQRVATALLYGIKSDTLLLNREASYLDIQAYLKLYTKANNSLLKRIERPEIPLAYIDCLKHAFTHLRVKNSIAVLPLGDVKCEEWIPQGADFSMQIEGARWALSAGVFKGSVVVSGRNCGYVHHCGEVFKGMFGYLGSAGGHRSMAKAIVDKKRWIEVFGASAVLQKNIGVLLHTMMKKELQTES